jgi:hypothetical protein
MTSPVTRAAAQPWLSPLLAAALCLAAVVGATDVLPPGPRTLAVTAFLVLAPGLGWVRLLRLEDIWHELALAIGLSLALDVLVVGVLEYWGDGDGDHALAVLIGITVAGMGADLRRRRSGRHGPGHGGHEEARTP